MKPERNKEENIGGGNREQDDLQYQEMERTNVEKKEGRDTLKVQENGPKEADLQCWDIKNGRNNGICQQQAISFQAGQKPEQKMERINNTMTMSGDYFLFLGGGGSILLSPHCEETSSS